ncbi:MAG: thiamine pyrophosphate-binding protein [Deltaproteobacteria bacterium]|nr:thiamine pyrophosphate-binding protein [Deltaproteobacteria bacterium]
METLSNFLAKIIKSLGFVVCVACPGSRNKYLLQAFSKHFRTIVCISEHSAGFFCLGLNKANRSCYAFVCVTSGTAVCELLPSVVEAFYSRCPLLIVSADLPFSFRSSGYPQAIDQTKIFGRYGLFSRLDWTVNKSAQLRFSQNMPSHWNVAFLEEDPVALKIRLSVV